MGVKMPRRLRRQQQRRELDQREPDDRIGNIMFEQSEHGMDAPFRASMLVPRREVSVNFTLTFDKRSPLQGRGFGRGGVSTLPLSTPADRKSVVEGKSVSGGVDLGGRCLMKKRKNRK